MYKIFKGFRGDYHIAASVIESYRDKFDNIVKEYGMVYIFCHGTERMLLFEEGPYYNALTLNGLNSKEELVAGNLHSLQEKGIVLEK